MIRLDKYLANANVGTRSQVKKLIKSGDVIVNDKICTDANVKIEEESKVVCQGNVIEPLANCVYMLNKPEGVVSATSDNEYRTVIDLLAKEGRKDLFSIGRLDKDTEGLLLITNDGALGHNLLSPRKHVSKTYLCVADKELSPEEMSEMEQGIDIGDDKKTLPCIVNVTSLEEACSTYNIALGNVDSLFERIDKLFGHSSLNVYSYFLTINEGRFHQVKRMFAHFGGEILYLNRVEFAGLKLDMTLELGEYRQLTEEEIQSITK